MKDKRVAAGTKVPGLIHAEKPPYAIKVAYGGVRGGAKAPPLLD